MAVKVAWRFFVLDLDNGDVFSVSHKLAKRFIGWDRIAMPSFAGRRVGVGEVRLELDRHGQISGISHIGGTKVPLDSEGRRDEALHTENIRAVMNVAMRSPNVRHRSTEAIFDERRSEATRFSGDWEDNPELFAVIEAVYVRRSKHPKFKGKAPVVEFSKIT